MRSPFAAITYMQFASYSGKIFHRRTNRKQRKSSLCQLMQILENTFSTVSIISVMFSVWINQADKQNLKVLIEYALNHKPNPDAYSKSRTLLGYKGADIIKLHPWGNSKPYILM